MEIKFDREAFRKYSNADYFEKIVNIETIPELLNHLKTNYSGLNAIGKEDGSIATFDEFLNDVNKVCYYLHSNNVEVGKHIGVLATNSYSFAVASIGIMAYGAVAVLLPFQLDKTIVFGCSKKYNLSGIMYVSSANEKLELLQNSGLLLANIADVLNSNPDKSYINNEIDKYASSCIIMTGGTTGRSKGAVLLYCPERKRCYGQIFIFI